MSVEETHTTVLQEWRQQQRDKGVPVRDCGPVCQGKPSSDGVCETETWKTPEDCCRVLYVMFFFTLPLTSFLPPSLLPNTSEWEQSRGVSKEHECGGSCWPHQSPENQLRNKDSQTGQAMAYR
ncbi:hypothetical protein GBAR_LOCUS31747 [Geodia barretti]|uniref:Uncharacterized protein n=1 Tax=Geodia barretti TaxID=519541 RepID=A0AA35U2V3_GEOBA|nr:hypothetical protein GBAR_LOCUS31747 [Geodia barretti]